MTVVQTLEQLSNSHPKYKLHPGDQLLIVVPVSDVNPLLPDEVEQRAFEAVEEINWELQSERPGWELVPTGFEQGETQGETTLGQVRVVLTNANIGASSIGALSSSLFAVELATISIVALSAAVIAVAASPPLTLYLFSNLSEEGVEAIDDVTDSFKFAAVAAVAVAVAVIAWSVT